MEVSETDKARVRQVAKAAAQRAGEDETAASRTAAEVEQQLTDLANR